VKTIARKKHGEAALGRGRDARARAASARRTAAVGEHEQMH
jgi:hypothetical protein